MYKKGALLVLLIFLFCSVVNAQSNTEIYLNRRIIAIEEQLNGIKDNVEENSDLIDGLNKLQKPVHRAKKSKLDKLQKPEALITIITGVIVSLAGIFRLRGRLAATFHLFGREEAAKRGQPSGSNEAVVIAPDTEEKS